MFNETEPPLFKIFVYLIFLLLSFDVSSQDLYLAGFSFIGDTTENSNYPVAVDLYKNNPLILNQQLKESLKKLKRKDINIISDTNGSIKTGNAVALAYGLQKESIATYQIEGGYQTKFEISGLIYLFDFADNEHKLIASFPTGSTVTVTSNDRLTRKEVKNYFENMYLPNKNPTSINITFDKASESSGMPSVSVFDTWVARLDNANITRAKKDNKLQVRSIMLDDAVVAQLPNNSDYLKDKKALITETARNFERDLSAYQNVPLLPYSVGQAIGGLMIARFGDTNFEVKIPPADFVIDILVREFKKSYVDNKLFDGFIYGAFITLKVVGTDLNDTKLESKFNYKTAADTCDKGDSKDAIICVQFPKKYKVKIEDDWPFWIGSQKKLFEILTKQISQRDDKQLAVITNNPNIKDDLKKFEMVIINCR